MDMSSSQLWVDHACIDQLTGHVNKELLSHHVVTDSYMYIGRVNRCPWDDSEISLYKGD